MKRSKNTAATTAGALLAISALTAGCAKATTVYGPPDVTEPIPTYQEENNIPAPVYGPPETIEPFSPEENIPEDVYGPPMPYEEEPEEPDENLPEEANTADEND